MGLWKKIERRLAGWKILYLSKGERITLIKSTLSNLSTYFFLSIFPLSASGPNLIEQKFQAFLWVGTGEESKSLG